ncbi:MAG: hypothetical protein IKW19_02135, partial [Akkermansia sp.]|nr:hypothetical protein [Akkermansia sp.]
MKTRETTPGKTYSVHTSSGCTVSDKNGWSKTIDAPDGYFTAHAGEVTIDGDDAADVREVFKLAPYQKLRLLGVVGGGAPAWKLKYAECRTVDDMLAVNPDYKNDLTSDGQWVYPLPNMVVCGDAGNGLFYNAHKLRKIKLVLPKATFIGWMFHIEAPSKLEEVDIEAPSLNYGSYVGCGHMLQGAAAPKKMRFVLPKQRSLRQFFWTTPPAYPQRLELYAPSMTEGDFVGASLDKVSVLEIIDRLQTFTSGTHALSISIHV